MADKVQFELVSPERLLLSEAVEMVVVPGVEGDFGVLPGHALFVSGVRPGVVDVHDGGGVKARIFVSGGFAEVTAERCTVLVDEGVTLGDIDRAAVEAKLKALAGDMADAKDDAERERIEARAAVEEAKLQALGAA